MKEKVNILVTGGGGPGYPLIFKGLRASTRYQARIVAGDLNPYAANMYIPEWVDVAYRLPPNTSPQFLEALYWIVKREGIDFLLSAVDEELSLISENADNFAALGCKTLLPTAQALEAAYDKEATCRLLRDAIPMPRTVIYEEGMDLASTLESFGTKVVIKACRTRGNRFNYPADCLDDLRFYAGKIARAGKRCMIQEFVEGAEFNVSLMRDRDGRMLYCVCREKMDPPLLRPNTSAGLIRRIPELERLAMDAVEILGLAPGTSNVEFLQSSTGAFFLIEVNGGRHAAQDMNLVHSGINIPEMLLDLAFDKSVEPVADSVIKEGTFCLKYTDEIIIDHGKLKATLREVPL